MPRAPLVEISTVFLRLGCTSFGGPVAHLGYFHAEFVQKRHWLSEEAYADHVALAQFLPGPASSQVVFALGQHRGGIPGALLASLCFTLPSTLLMLGFALGLGLLGDLGHAGWLHGLKLAAAAVVAQAVWTMGRKLCPDLPRLGLAALAAAAAFLLPGTLSQLAVISAGACLGWLFFRGTAPVVKDPLQQSGLARHHFWAAATLALFAALLLVLPALAASTGSPGLRLFDIFYRSGSLVFGGGHVILPLLRTELVPTRLVSNDAFLAGYGAAQALPGPLFTFSAYLGTLASPWPQTWLGGLLCLLGVFLPAWLLIGGALPFWHFLRSKPGAQAALRGTNATVVGLLFAALCHPILSESLQRWQDPVLILLAFALLEWKKLPSWLVVILCAVAGQLLN